ncbi:MAG: hypothetical protein AAB490_03705 [Patescibacteria group bacterium]
MDSLVLDAIRTTPLAEMGALFKILAARIYEHRRSHKGFVPLELFEWCMAIGGMQAALEVLPILPAVCGSPTTRFALKHRTGKKESSWQGLYQIPGATAVPDRGPRDLLNRVSAEFYGQHGRTLLFDELVYVGTEVHNEPERLSSCLTVVYVKHIQALAELDGAWRIFTDVDLEQDNAEIVDHHRETLKWLLRWEQPGVVDLRLHQGTNWLELNR